MSGSIYGIKDEVLQKTDIVGLFSEYVKVKRAGASFMAICPFHSEKSPSLHLTPDKGLWYCHGCGEGGNAIGFVERMEGLDRREAMRFLARKAGITVSEDDFRENSEREELLRINEAAAKFYHEHLLKSPAAERARAYVAKRQIDEFTQDDFRIGYSPDSWDALYTFLRQKGVSDDLLYKAGLCSRSEKTGRLFDRFRNRLMFPISDKESRVVGFTARVLPGPDGKDPKDEAKYVNTSQTQIYNKSGILYGLNLARKEIKAKNLAVVVEGNMDVIASHQAGVKHVVASSGTSFTSEQLAILKNLTDKLVLSFDNDAAGETAARRSIDLAMQHGFTVRVLRLPDGMKDPDDAVKKGAEVWSQAIADAVPYMDWFIGLAKSRTDFGSHESVRDASNALLREIAKLGSPVERQYWLRQISQVFDTPESVLFETVQRLSRPTSSTPQAASAPFTPFRLKKAVTAPKPRLTRDGLVSQNLLAMAIRFPECAARVVAEVPPAIIEDEVRPLYTEFVLHYNAQRSGGATASDFSASLEAQELRELADRASVLQLLAEREFADLAHEQRRDELTRLIGESKQLHKSRRQHELKHAMALAEQSGDAAAIQDIQRQLSELIL